MKNGKAAGPNGIAAKALKTDLSTTYKHSTLIKKSKEEIKHHNKGDLGKCSDSRGITLLSVPGKVLSKVALGRLKDAVDSLPRNQYTHYRRKGPHLDQTAALCVIFKQLNRFEFECLHQLCDYEKAFDSVDKETLWKLLLKLVNLIKNT